MFYSVKSNNESDFLLFVIKIAFILVWSIWHQV